MLLKLLMGLLALLCLAASADAQIVNTLRGLSDTEAGWSGNIEGAVAIADGNTNYFEYEVTGATQHMSEKTRWRLIGRYMRRSASDVTIAESRLSHLRHNYQISTLFATVLLAQAQHDPFRRVETRILLGAGGRADLLRTENWNGAVGATYLYEDEELTDDQGFTTDSRLSFFLTLYSSSTETVHLDITSFYQPRINDFSDARAYTEATARVDIIGDLYLIVTYALLHDSKPPSGVMRTDQTLRSGLGFSF